jgi:Xaa-Pro aminopeptidase
MSTVAANEELARLRVELAADSIAVAVFASTEAVTYASGWEVPVPLGALADLSWASPTLVIGPEDAGAMLVVPDNLAAGAASAAVDEVVPFATFDGVSPIDGRAAYLAALERALRVVCGRVRRGAVALEERRLPAAAAAAVAAALPGWTSPDAEPALLRARAVKTAREIARLRHAARLADAGHAALAAACRAPGVDEHRLWADVAAAVFAAHGRDIPLTGEVVTGPRTESVAYPNGPRSRTTEAGDPVLMDLSGRADGYWFDCTNTLLVGNAEPTAAQRRLARASQAACEAAMAALRPGAAASDAAAAAARAFAGFGLPMAHYAGHQIGVSVNELPRLVPYDPTPIRAGMVFSVEPGAYAGPGGGFGARSEKMVLVTEAGPEVLSSFAWGI